jgi:hypothetical protein
MVPSHFRVCKLQVPLILSFFFELNHRLVVMALQRNAIDVLMYLHLEDGHAPSFSR